LWPLPDLRSRGEQSQEIPEEPSEPNLAQLEFERGLEQGKEEGRREAEAMVASAMAALGSVYDELTEARRSMAADNERAVHTLAIAVAQQIVQREIAADPTVVRDLVSNALEQVGGDGPTTVRINPADLEVVSECVESDQAGSIQWLPDTTLERGSCVIEAPHRIVDGRIESALKELFHRLNDV
jgi:flagellar biosynthesis/type III secretory pathway protein FliH